MKFCTTALLGFLATVGGASAFSPTGFVPNPSGLMIPQGQGQQQQPKGEGGEGYIKNMNMVAGGAERAMGQEYYEGAPIGPPPDLPSELLYLNYESTDPITMYINSSGTTTANGQAVGFETEAFAIADVMKYVRPPVHTVALGQAFGAAAMLLSQGKKGYRFSMPNATILLNQPKSQAQGQASDIAIKAQEVAHNRRTMCELIASACGKPVDNVIKDCSRVKYLQPHEAVEYGLVDKVIENGEKAMPTTPTFMNQLAK
eukprot:CAMPEP_0170893808 /NCGR_PEP_ID=MMETSP0734-20130129/42667_1 /TAXON_ID=186038 /ORGANISM="Fragilariopsis kerguelensis, Strain L26-C5" /LENGTH=257 /DNA_ID=CAMNT_0011284425 /DNA_START=139 /DNA_END=912 /DNA_ORIENTATION=-